MRSAILLVLALAVVGTAAAQDEKLKMSGTITVNSVGNATFDATLDLTPAQYSQAAKMYKHNPYELVRDFQKGGGSAPSTAVQGEIDPDSIKIEFLDKDTDVHLKMNFIGAAYCTKGGWVLGLDKGAKMVAENGSTLTFMADVPPSNPLEVGVIGNYTVNLPQDATEPKFNPDKGELNYTTPLANGTPKTTGAAAMVGSFVVALLGLIVAGSGFVGRGAAVQTAATVAAPIAPPAQSPTVPSPPAPQPSQTRAAAFCSACGTKLSGGEAFCPGCGASVAGAARDQRKTA
jgi:hypothetical protein